MAITPAQAGKLTEAELNRVAEAEGYLDTQLQSPKDYMGRRIARPTTTNHRVLEELLRRYRAAGWRVEVKSDPVRNDGTWWEFYE